MTSIHKFLVTLFLAVPMILSAQTARIKGIILDETNAPVANVNITALDKTTATNENGFYQLTIPANQKVTVVFTHITLKKVTATIELNANEDYEFNVLLSGSAEMIGDVIITTGNRKRVQGITVIEPDVIRRIPGANAGVENILKTLPGVYSNNELSTSYAVRGGNYDENLVYVNEVEVYRPYLIRSGQQEGLSFTNTDLVQNVDFSAG